LPNKKAKQKKWDKKKRSEELKQRKRAKRLQLKQLRSRVEFLEEKLAIATKIINEVNSDTTVELAKLIQSYKVLTEDKSTF
jgi:hypothetical protein